MQLTAKQQESFWSKVVKTDSCWIWQGAKIKNGYGRLCMSHNGVARHYLAHRISVQITTGQMPDRALCVCHKCDNPSCVNPAHLFLATQKANMRDAKAKHRKWHGENAGEKNGRCRITEEIARNIKEALKESNSITEISEAFSVSKHIVANIRYSRAWAHLAV